MHYAYAAEGNRLIQLQPDADLRQALWIDLIQPTDAEMTMLRALGFDLPTLADMEEIELSNRLYREELMDYMTAMLPGEVAGGGRPPEGLCASCICSRFLLHCLKYLLQCSKFLMHCISCGKLQFLTKNCRDSNS